MKEKGAMMLHSLCFQPRGLDGDQQADNDVLIAKSGAVKPLVTLIGVGSPIASPFMMRRAAEERRVCSSLRFLCSRVCLLILGPLGDPSAPSMSKQTFEH